MADNILNKGRSFFAENFTITVSCIHQLMAYHRVNIKFRINDILKYISIIFSKEPFF